VALHQLLVFLAGDFFRFGQTDVAIFVDRSASDGASEIASRGVTFEPAILVLTCLDGPGVVADGVMVSVS